MAIPNDAMSPGEFSQGLEALGKLLIAIQAPGGIAVTAENIAAKIDPALAPEIMAAQLMIPLLGAVLEILGTQSGVVAPRWMGAPRAP